VRNHYDTVFWLKLDKSFFNFDTDVYICALYLWCDESPAYTVHDIDLFDIIQQDISDFDSVGHKLHVVNDFNYLGTVFNYTGNFALNQEQLVGKALKALNVLLIKCNKYRLKTKLLCQLFDSFVGSILNYASEIWGYGKSKEIERVHLKFCKKILNVNIRTSNAAVYGELARYPLYILRHVKILKFWFRIIKTDNVILKEVYNISLNDCNNSKTNWVTKVKKLLNENGFNYIWNNPESVDVNLFIPMFKQRLIDTFVQTWHVDKENNNVLDLYTNIKHNFTYELYLDILPSNLRFLAHLTTKWSR
jgi:hypothetical protein